MCGILGQVDTRPIVRETFLRMRETLAHRGPDGAGAFFSPDGLVALGHRRLSIIDLSDAAAQPMANEDGTVRATYNGEIYNFQELRAQLVARGHVFRSRSDTEVLVHGYEEWGEDCVERLRGMFAFGLWDARARRLVLATDPFRIKPLYYCHGDGRFLFASELKAIVADGGTPRVLDAAALCDYLTYRYVPTPRTIWRGVAKLPPATVLVYEDGRVRTRRYWTPPADVEPVDEARALEVLDERLDASVRGHRISDVPVGLFLSGGMDSSTLAYYLHRQGARPDAFCIGFEARDSWYNELPDARAVARHFGLSLTEAVARADVWGLLPTLMRFYDEPFADSSMFPTYMVSQLAAARVKVALSGDGGDELFAGYDRYFAPGTSWRRRMADLLRRLCLRRAEGVDDYLRRLGPPPRAGELRRLLAPALHDELARRPGWFLEEHDQPTLPWPKRWQELDIQTILPDQYLTKIDRASMAHSLEVRVPYLDRDLAEFVLRLPPAVYSPPGRRKHLLTRRMDGRLPEQIRRKRKRGFGIPLGEYLSFALLRRHLLEGPAAGDGLVQRDGLRRMREDGTYAQLHRLWQLAVFDVWYGLWRRAS